MGEIDTKINLLGIEIDNPIIPASGTFGFGYEFAEIYDINMLGTFSFKGTTAEPRFGNPTPRIAECPAGMINCIGLQNPGIEKVICEELPKLAKVFHKPVMANISGFSLEEYVSNCEKIDKVDMVGWIELNVSCPNVHGGGLAFGTDPDNVRNVVKAVKKVIHKPLIVKLSPNVTDIVAIAKAAEEGGADAISLINSLMGLRIDLKTGEPILGIKTGGLSGPCVLPVALRCVYQVAHAVKIPVIGMGGISKWQDAVEMLMAGASALQIGTVLFNDPYAPVKINEGLNRFLDEKGMTSVTQLTGAVQPW